MTLWSETLTTLQEEAQGMDEREKLSFWVSRELADQVRQTLLDHKKATRKRVTFTEILTEALEEYVQGKRKN
mgnify:FL=1